MPFAKILLLYAHSKQIWKVGTLWQHWCCICLLIKTLKPKNDKIWLSDIRHKNNRSGISYEFHDCIYRMITIFFTKLYAIVLISRLYPRRELLISHITIIISWYMLSLSDRYNTSQFICNNFRRENWIQQCRFQVWGIFNYMKL